MKMVIVETRRIILPHVMTGWLGADVWYIIIQGAAVGHAHLVLGRIVTEMVENDLNPEKNDSERSKNQPHDLAQEESAAEAVDVVRDGKLQDTTTKLSSQGKYSPSSGDGVITPQERDPSSPFQDDPPPVSYY